MGIKIWNIEAMTGYKPKTSFYQDFSIADAFGNRAIVDTYKRAYAGWKRNIEYITELYMVLNWKIWEHYQAKPGIAKLYQSLYEELYQKIVNDESFTKDEIRYFYRTID